MAVIAFVALSACTTTEYVPQIRTVEVPVVEYRAPKVTEDLKRKFTPSEVKFRLSGDLICMDQENAGKLRSDLERAAGKLKAWKSFYLGLDHVK